VETDAREVTDRWPAEASYMKKRTTGHTETSISGDTRADWSEAFALVPSLDVAYVWHASKFTREVLDGLLRIGFLHRQQIVWNKGRTVLTRTHYWFQHEPCWYVRKKNAPWFGKAGENSTVWDSPSPKFIMGGSDEDKFDHPTQKPVDFMRRPILNHLRRGELVYDPFLGSGTPLKLQKKPLVAIFRLRGYSQKRLLQGPPPSNPFSRGPSGDGLIAYAVLRRNSSPGRDRARARIDADN
jgi:DNA methylase